MRSSFPALRFGLLVGIAGGAPSKNHDIRLGDVVVSAPTPRQGGVIQYDYGKALDKHLFEETGHLASPPEALLIAISNIKAKHEVQMHEIQAIIENMLDKFPYMHDKYSRPDLASDELYKLSWFGMDRLVTREKRKSSKGDPVIHYGLIASANRLMKDRRARDALIAKYDVLCFEMEAAGVMNNFPCLVIRGICDYSDRHKNKTWQGYAAATAAAYAKELLEVIPGKNVSAMQSIEETAIEKAVGMEEFHLKFSLEGIPIAKDFVDRPDEMHRLEEALLPSGHQDTYRKLFILSGLGGIGKTQLAVRFIRLHKSHCSAILWLDGSTEDSLRRSIAHFHSRIYDKNMHCLADEDTMKENEVDVLVAQVLEWLSLPKNNRWLLVFDNVDHDIDDMTDDLAYDIRQYYPHADHGFILITTRLLQLHQLGKSQVIRNVNMETARSILINWYETAENDSDCQDLLEVLDGLPLAIVQAGAYLHQNGMSIKKYLEIYKRKRADVQQIIHRPDFRLKDYPGRNVWTAWILSYEAVLRRDKHAGQLLFFWSSCNRSDFWHGVFAAATKKPGVAQALRQALGSIAEHEESFLDAMTLLRGYSLVESTNSQQGYSMHAVLHMWLSLFQTRQERLEMSLLTPVLISAAIPDEHECNSAQQRWRLLPHALACCQSISHLEDVNATHLYRTERKSNDLIGIRDVIEAFKKLGTLYDSQGRMKEAEEMYRCALTDGKEMLGTKDVLTIATAVNLGGFCVEQDKMVEAKEILLQALVDAPTLEDKYISIQFTLYNYLGNFYAKQCDYGPAGDFYNLALQGNEIVLGPEHHDTICVVNNLGIVYAAQSRAGLAEGMYKRALAGQKDVIRGDPVLTFDIISGLGVLIFMQGQPKAAETLYKQALAGYKDLLGTKHSKTITTTSSLGSVYLEMDMVEEAELILLQAIRDCEESVGLDKMATYPPALLTMFNLGSVYTKNHPDKARDYYRKALYGYRINQGDLSPKCILLKRRLEELECQIQRQQTA